MTDPVALHQGLLTLDTHIDIPWPDGPAFTDDTQRRVDLPKMRRGHLAGACFAAYAPQGPRTEAGYQAAFARVSVVVMRPCSKRLVTRPRSTARRCHGFLPSFDPDFKCRMFFFSVS